MKKLNKKVTAQSNTVIANAVCTACPCTSCGGPSYQTEGSVNKDSHNVTLARNNP